MPPTEKDPFEEEEDGKQSIPVTVAVLKAKVAMLTYLVKEKVVWKDEFSHVRLIAHGVVAVLVAALGALLLSYLKH